MPYIDINYDGQSETLDASYGGSVLVEDVREFLETRGVFVGEDVDVADIEGWSVDGADGFGDLVIGDRPNLEKLGDLGEKLEGNEGLATAFLLFLENEYPQTDYADALNYWDEVEEKFCATFTDREQWAEEEVSSIWGLSEIPPIIQTNIDWSGVADDLEGDYSIYEATDGTSYVFRNY